MKSVCVTFLLVVAMLLPAWGDARSMGDLFADEPGVVFPMLTRTARLDMMDYYRSGQQVDVANNLAGDSRLLELDSTYVKVRTSGSRTVEMRLLTSRRDTVIAVIETAFTPLPDSRLTLWTASWRPVKNAAKRFRAPVIDDFVTGKMTPELRADLEDEMLFPLIGLTFEGQHHDTIAATHSLDRFLTPERYKRFAAYLKPTLTYRISGTAIKPVNQP